MEILDTAEGRAAPSQETHSSVDRFETVRIFEEREEELKVEAAMALYEKAARARMMPIPSDLPDNAGSEEEREAASQRLKLQQKCQDIRSEERRVGKECRL